MEKTSLQLNKNSELRRQRRMRVLFVAALLVLVGIALVVALLRRPEFQISSVVVVDAQATDPGSIESFVKKQIAGNYFLVIPKTNALLFSKIAMRRAILDMFPDLKNAVAEFPQRNHLVIRITEKEPAYVWCAQSCWFLDDNGVLYGEAPRFSDGVFVTFTGTTTGEPLPADPRRKTFASFQEFNQAKHIIQTLESKIHIVEFSYLQPETPVVIEQTEQKVSENTTPLIGDVWIRITQINDVSVSRDAVVKITQKTDPQDVLKNIDLLLSQGKFSDLLNSQPQLLEYIDLRFDGKIYYKFKSQAAVPAESGIKNAQ